MDAGTGTLLGPSLGRLPAALRAAGYDAEAVDDVVLTHVHADHSGGLTRDGAAVFPRARLHVCDREIAYWLDPARSPATPAAARRGFEQAAASLAPYRDTGRLETFAGDGPVLPGLRSLLRPGHTPGHCSLRVEGGGAAFVAWGDVTHGAAVQLSEPGVAISFDVDQAGAISARRVALEEAASEACWVAGAHLPFPGVGHVARSGGAFEWVPAN